MKNTRLLTGLAVAAALAIPGLAGAATETVFGNTSAGENQPGWMFARDLTTASPYEFNTDAASIGSGSLYAEPLSDTTAAKKFIAENFINTPVSNINSIAFDFKIGAGGLDTEEEQFYMNVYANFGVSDDLKFYDCRYDVVASVGSTAGFTTVTFDPTLPYPVTTRTGGSASPFPCPAIPADMDTISAGSNVRAFSLNIGDTSLNDAGLDGYLDNVVVNLDSGVTTYDFDPNPDADNDGVPIGDDKCPATTADAFPQWNKSKGRYQWNGTTWVGTKDVPKDFMPDMDYTHGCSGKQILDAVALATGLDFGGHYKFGITKGLLEAWHEGTYYLGRQFVERVTVDSALIGGAESLVSLDDAKNYFLVASGTYGNRPGERADAQYVTMDNWLTHTDGPTGGYPVELLDLQVENAFVNWGPYNGAHTYELAYTPVADGTLNLRVFDGDVNTNTPDAEWYGDNVGVLEVDIIEDVWVDLW